MASPSVLFSGTAIKEGQTLTSEDNRGPNASSDSSSENEPLLAEVFSSPSGNEVPESFLSPSGNQVPEGKEIFVNETSPQLSFGMKASAKILYEGPAKCQCCKNWVEEYPDDLKSNIEVTKESQQHAVLVRYRKCHSNSSKKPLEVDSVVIQSPLLKTVLGRVFNDYPGITPVLECLTFNSPFQPFLHRWEVFQDEVAKETYEASREHLKVLSDVIEAELKDIFRAKADFMANKVITHEYIWTLFKPSTTIYSKDGSHERLYRLKSSAYQPRGFFPASYNLTCDYIDWDGSNFGYSSKTLSIPEFEGTTAIADLSSYPLEFHSSPESLQRDILERGRKFVAWQGYHYKAYQGVARACGTFGQDISIDGRIVIDAEAFFYYNPGRVQDLRALDQENNTKIAKNRAECFTSNDHFDSHLHSHYDSHLHSHYDSEDYLQYGMTKEPRRLGVDALSSQLKELSDAQALLCTPWVKGYSLTKKNWAEFSIVNIDDITWNENAFASLVLPGEYKDLILGYVEEQIHGEKSFDDVIEGKGQGLILLLAGPPGVGKTLCAEAVAENLRVPLYVISGGDLGTKPTEVETSLNTALEVVARWNAVLLLDEADVFLEQRTIHDLERNSLVSVFLRKLEYSRGVLVLTTNRLHTIDTAFESRIHVILSFPELDKASRKVVWQNFLSLLKQPHNITEEDVDIISDRVVNGRQIKNAVKLAQLIAKKQRSQLEARHLLSVLQTISLQFTASN